MGITQSSIQKSLVSKEFVSFKKTLNDLTQFKKVIVASVDHIHPLSGLRNKLLAYQHFLKNYLPFRKSVCLV